MIYLDNAATTPLLDPVTNRMMQILQQNFGNPSSLHALGREAAKILRESRDAIAGVLSVPPSSITFTSGGTEANNQALLSYALAYQHKGKHLLATAIEHPSVLETLKYLEKMGFEIELLAPESDGTYNAEQFMRALRPDTLIVSMMMANNETGQLLPVKELGEQLASHPAVFHVDAVQALGKISVSPSEIGADFLTGSAHKFHGPKGAGFLYHSPSVKFDSFIHGGEQEEKKRAGTENLAAIAGMATALFLADAEKGKNFESVHVLKKQLLSNLTEAQIDFYLNEFGPTLPHVINLGFADANHDRLLTLLDLAGFAVSTGSACTAGTVEPSHVLESVYGKDSQKLKENLRVSLSELNTKEEIDAFTNQLKEVL